MEGLASHITNITAALGTIGIVTAMVHNLYLDDRG